MSSNCHITQSHLNFDFIRGSYQGTGCPHLLITTTTSVHGYCFPKVLLSHLHILSLIVPCHLIFALGNLQRLESIVQHIERYSRWGRHYSVSLTWKDPISSPSTSPAMPVKISTRAEKLDLTEYNYEIILQSQLDESESDIGRR